MKWKKFSIKTTTLAEDIIVATLDEIGIQGAEIEDKQPLTEDEKAQMFVDIMPEGPANDGVAYVNYYLEEDEDAEAILENVKVALDELRSFMDIGEGTITASETEDKDWINNWKQYFSQFYVDDILIIPSWEDVKVEDQDRMVLHIDPGTAFGTGMHETTQLCIRQLKKYITPETHLLDVGTGSGILAILALMYGAKSAVGTDLDICAIEATKEKDAICIINQCDRPQLIDADELHSIYQTVITLSAKTGEGLDGLTEEIKTRFTRKTEYNDGIVTNPRHMDALRRSEAALDAVCMGINCGMTADVITVDLEDAIDALGELTGQTASEDVMNGIFSRFCVGK
jgi:ribosomal protein L11 methyltransferase